ncbi:hypothetical protein H8E52_01840 [bacterium]|nr:hypothetical protein [bacterium]
MIEDTDFGGPSDYEDEFDPGPPAQEIQNLAYDPTKGFEDRTILEIDRRIALGDLLKLYIPFQLKSIGVLSVMMSGQKNPARTQGRR